MAPLAARVFETGKVTDPISGMAKDLQADVPKTGTEAKPVAPDDDPYKRSPQGAGGVVLAEAQAQGHTQLHLQKTLGWPHGGACDQNLAECRAAGAGLATRRLHGSKTLCCSL